LDKTLQRGTVVLTIILSQSIIYQNASLSHNIIFTIM